MPEIPAAERNIQGVNVTILFLSSDFDSQAESEQIAAHNDLQIRATNAGLRGNVVLVWTDSHGNAKFRAPKNQQVFFASTNYELLVRQINKKLYW